jgi:hypothetical protein
MPLAGVRTSGPARSARPQERTEHRPSPSPPPRPLPETGLPIGVPKRRAANCQRFCEREALPGMPGGVNRVADALQTQEVPSSPRAQSTRDGSSVPRKSGWIVVNEDLQNSPPEFPCSLQVGRPLMPSTFSFGCCGIPCRRDGSRPRWSPSASDRLRLRHREAIREPFKH